MTRALAVDAPAKINLFLRVERRRPDGFHDLTTIFHAIDLCDTLEIEVVEGERDGAGGPASLVVEGPSWAREIPVGPGNLVLRADALIRARHAGLPAVRYRLTKRIPAQAGLGGGSADAAAALVGLVAMFGLGETTEELAELAGRLGSDTSFCVRGGCAIGRGRGERLEPVASRLDAFIVLARPPLGIATAAAYAACEPLGPTPPAELAGRVAAIEEGDAEATAAALSNSFDSPCLPGQGVLSALRRHFVDAGMESVALSGSGSALFAFARDADDAERARRAIAAADPTAWTATARLIPHGPVARPVATVTG